MLDNSAQAATKKKLREAAPRTKAKGSAGKLEPLQVHQKTRFRVEMQWPSR